MIDLERKLGPLRIRAWGLVVNLLANATALYGLARWLDDGSGMPILITGTSLTLVCIAVLAAPARDSD